MIKKFTCALIGTIFGTLTCIQASAQSVLDQWEKQNHQLVKVIDVADAVFGFYNSKDPVFSAATYVALSCAEKAGQDSLIRLAEEILRLPAKAKLERFLAGIVIHNENHQKASTQIASEFSKVAEGLIREFFSQSISNTSATPATVECFLSRIQKP